MFDAKKLDKTINGGLICSLVSLNKLLAREMYVAH